MCYNNCMKKISILILTLFLFLINTLNPSDAAITKKEYRVVADDGFALNSVLSYPKVKTQAEYKTVVLIHSLGYSSQWWETLPAELNSRGYAVLTIDLRGHGTSVYNKNLGKISWKDMTNSAYSKCPSDVVKIINYIIEDNPKRTFFKDWAIVGSDLGASVGIIAADKLEVKPKTIVVLSPVVKTKGLYIPVSMAQLSNVDYLLITGHDDLTSKSAQDYLSRFAQAGFTTYESPAHALGMLLLKKDPELVKLIAEWVSQYLSL